MELLDMHRSFITGDAVLFSSQGAKSFIQHLFDLLIDYLVDLCDLFTQASPRRTESHAVRSS